MSPFPVREKVKLSSFSPIQSDNPVLNRVQQNLASLLNPLLREINPVVGQTLLAFLTDLPAPRPQQSVTTDFVTVQVRAPSDSPRVAEERAVIPTSSTSRGTAGQVCRDNSYLYVCTATDTWRRVALSTF